MKIYWNENNLTLYTTEEAGKYNEKIGEVQLNSRDEGSVPISIVGQREVQFIITDKRNFELYA